MTTRLSLLVAVAAVSAAAAACAPPPAPALTCVDTGPRPAGLLAAGSGVWSAIVERGPAAGEPLGVQVAPSIGSGGAVAALLDGEIDVGLLSRPLRPRERAAGLQALPPASSRLIFASARGPILERERLLGVYRGTTVTIDGGHRARPLVREPGDSGWPVICETDAELCRAMKDAAAAGRAEVVWTDTEMATRVRTLSGAVGPLDWHAVPLLRFAPTAGPGGLRDLYVVVRADASEAVKAVAKRLSELPRGAR